MLEKKQGLLELLMQMLSQGKDAIGDVPPVLGREVGTGSAATNMRAMQDAKMQGDAARQSLGPQLGKMADGLMEPPVPPMPTMGSIDMSTANSINATNPNGMRAPNSPLMSRPPPLSAEQEAITLQSRMQGMQAGGGNGAPGFTAPVDLMEQRMGDMLGRGPAANTNTMYPIAKGDNLTAIGSRSNLTVEQLMQLNPQISDPNVIQAGQQLNLGNASIAPRRPAFGGKPSLAVPQQGMMGPPQMNDPPMPSAGVQAPQTSDPLELLRAKLRGGAMQTPMRKPIM